MRAADVWYEAYRRRVANFDNWLGGKNAAPTFFGAMWTFWWCVRDDIMRGRRIRQLREAAQEDGARQGRAQGAHARR